MGFKRSELSDNLKKKVDEAIKKEDAKNGFSGDKSTGAGGRPDDPSGLYSVPEVAVDPGVLVSWYNRERWFHVKPMGKPRMTRRDVWKDPPRPSVARWRSYKDQLALQSKNFRMPLYNYWIIFHIPMAKSWWPAKKRRHVSRIHQQQKPDKDNLEKAFLDAILDEDHGVGDGRVSKIWAPTGEGKIQIKWFDPNHENK